MAVSADSVKESAELSQRLGLRFPIACGLTVEHMNMLGLFVHIHDPETSPKAAYCVPKQTSGMSTSTAMELCLSAMRERVVDRPFCEPAHIILRPDNTVKSSYQPTALFHL